MMQSISSRNLLRLRLGHDQTILARIRGRGFHSLASKRLMQNNYRTPLPTGIWVSRLHSLEFSTATTSKRNDENDNSSNNNNSSITVKVQTSKSTLARLADLSRPEWPLLVSSIATLTLTSSVMLVFPYAAGQVIDITAAGQGDPIMFAGGLFGLTCVSGGGVYLRALWLAQAGNRVVARLRQQTYHRLLLQENDFFQQRHDGDLVGPSKGDLLSRLSSDAQLIQSALTVHVVSVLRGAVISLGSAMMLLTMSPSLAGLSLCTLPPIFIVARTTGRDLQTDQKMVQQALGDSTALADQALQSLDTVKQYVAEQYESHRYSASIGKAHRQAVKTAHRQAQLEGFTHVAANGAVLAVLGYGGTLVLDGILTPGDLTGFVLYSFMLAGSLSNLSSLYADIVRAIAASERVFDILDRQPTVPPPNQLKPSADLYENPLQRMEPWHVPRKTQENHSDRQAVSVTVHNLTFSYASRPEKCILNGLSLNVEPGKVVALVGGSGSGKSTLAKLMTRLYAADSNTIFINDRCISSLSVGALREQISVVSQDPVLFQGTIRENIRYGSWHASDCDVLYAAELANVMEFAFNLTDGLDTLVTPSTLSGGQRQRVAIARALCKDAPLIVLDEATASLDAQSEHFVHQAMDGIFQQNKTVISIAHRLSTIRHADTIFVIRDGKVAQQGSFEELAADRDGAFWNLMKTQLLTST